MAYIGKIPATGNFVKLDAISVVNGQASYTMQSDSVNFTPESANHMLVSLNGVIQAPITSFTVSGSTITFASNLVTGDVIDFIMVYGNVLDIGTPSDDTVSTAKLQANAVTTAKITDANITTAKIANDAVDKDKVNLISTSSSAGLEVKGDGTSDGYLQLNCSQNSHGIKLKSPPHSASASYTLTFPNNDGNADQVLTTNGSGVLSFADAGGGGLVLLQSTDITSDTAEVEFTNLDSTYSKYLLSFSAHPASDSVYPALRFFTGSAYVTGNYTWGIQNYVAGGGESSSDSGSASYVRLSPNGIGNANDESCQFNVYITDPSRTDNHKLVSFQGAGFDSAGNSFGTYGGGTNTSFTTAVTKIKFLFESGNIGYGSFQFFGVAKA